MEFFLGAIAVFILCLVSFCIGDSVGQSFMQRKYEAMLRENNLLYQKDGRTYWNKMLVGNDLRVVLDELNRLQAKCGEEVTEVAI